MKKPLALICVIASFSLSCNRGPATTSTGKPTVALVLKTLNHPFFVDMRRGAQEAADRLGVTLQVQAAEREIDVEKQMQIVENLIQTGIQALCITPSGSREIVSALVKARDAKVPIVVVDTRLDPKAAGDAGVRAATFVGSDNYEGGKIAGEYLVGASNGKARVAILEGIPGHETGDSRLRGFRDAVKGAPGISIVASQPANWERDQGFNVFQNMLQAHADIDSVFACSDLMALGAIEAIAAAGKTGTIRVIGFDALDDAKQAIAAGTMAASVAQFPSEMGRAAVESAVKVIRGERVPPEINVKLELVTKSVLEKSEPAPRSVSEKHEHAPSRSPTGITRTGSQRSCASNRRGRTSLWRTFAVERFSPAPRSGA